MFIVKLDSDGNHVWSQVFGGVGTDSVDTLIVDQSGSIYFAGSMGSGLDFGGGALTFTGTNDRYLVKFDNDGNHIWSRSWGNLNFTTGMTTDSSNNIFMVGSLNSSMDFGTGTLNLIGLVDMFVVKFDSNGNTLWANNYGGTASANTLPREVDMDELGNLNVIGYFTDTVDLDSGSVTSGGGQDPFIVQYDTNGNTNWTQTYSGDLGDQFETLDHDINNNILICGNYASSAIDFGAGTVASVAGTDIVFLKLNFVGTYLWSKTFGSLGNDSCQGIAAMSDHRTAVGLNFNGTIDFGGGSLTSVSFDLFLGKFDY